jgi:hypothetical protein
MTTTKLIHNVATGEIEILALTSEEIAERKAQIQQWKTEREAREQQALLAKQTKISAYQKLGLTEAEIEALIPTPIVDELTA